ncbi:MAG: aspartate/glutamate racemase family protein [Betaproteobacteria bacterium]
MTDRDANAPRATTRVALIHAVTVAMQPVADAFAADWPAAELVNILDDALGPDRARDAALTPSMAARIGALADYAVCIGADAILYTCSAFGPAIDAAALRVAVPVLKPNEAMFEAALRRGRRIGMLATFAPSVASMSAEFREQAARDNPDATLRTVVVEQALEALKAGDARTHNRLLAERAPALADCDAILLAHFSTSRALAAVERAVAVPVLTSPGAAVAKLKRRFDVA